MQKKNIIHTNLSNKELEFLKDFYIEKKVQSMNNNDLKNFVKEQITLQIKSTIGEEEELEAWQEMESFFQEEFPEIIKNIQLKFVSENENQEKFNNESIKNDLSNLLNKEENKKVDMWEE